MSILKGQSQNKREIDASELIKTLDLNITKSEVKKMLAYPGMVEKIVGSGVQEIIKKYDDNGVANKALTTVLIEASYHSILKEKIKGIPNEDLEGKIELYSHSKILELCNNAIVVGSDSMVYSINELHSALKNDMEVTLRVLEIIGPMSSAKEIDIGRLSIHDIIDTITSSENEVNPLQIAREAVERVAWFKGIYDQLNTNIK